MKILKESKHIFTPYPIIIDFYVSVNSKGERTKTLVTKEKAKSFNFLSKGTEIEISDFYKSPTGSITFVVTTVSEVMSGGGIKTYAQTRLFFDSFKDMMDEGWKI